MGSARLHLLVPVCLTVLVLAAAARAVLEDAKIRLTVEGARVQFEPGVVRLRIRIEPDPENRGVSVGIVAPAFEASSWEDLPGERAAKTRWRVYTGIPAGEYLAVATVFRSSRRDWHTTAPFTILPRH